MRVLMITGDKNVLAEGTPAHERFLLQKSQVEELRPVYWGRGAFWAPLRTKGSYDVVTVQDPFLRGVVGWLTALRLGARFNVQVHTDLRAQGVLKRAISSFVLRRADSVRAVSKRIADSLGYLGVPVRTLPIYIDVEAISSAISANARSEHPMLKRMILVSSRLEPEKNVAAAIKAMPQILKALPDVGLFIAGSGSQQPYLQHLASELGIKDSVIFLGFRRDIFSLYKEASVLLATSFYEGYGASVVEALAAGTPVVSPDTGIAREAGATIAKENEYAQKVIEVIQLGAKGELNLSFVDKESWAKAWKGTL